MPAYNQEHLIVESIESVLKQTFQDWELIIGDDCSTDKTFEVASVYQQRFPEKIKVFRNEKNLGITGNCNELLKHCNAKYIAFTAGDDIFLDDKLEKQVHIMESSPDCILTYHDIEVFDSDTGKVIRYWNHGLGSTSHVVGDSKKVAKMLVLQGTAFMAALSVVARRSALPKHGYDTRVVYASDWLMWIDTCAGSNGKVQFIDQTLARYRKHQNSITHNTLGDNTDQFVTLAIVEARYSWLREFVRRRRGYEYYREGIALIMAGNYVVGRSQILLGIRTYMWSLKAVPWWVYSWFKQVLVKH